MIVVCRYHPSTSLWLGYDLFLYHSGIKNVCVDSSRLEAFFIFGIKLVPPQDGRHVPTSMTEAEPVARSGRRVSMCSSPVCARFRIYFVWEINSCHDHVCQKPSYK